MSNCRQGQLIFQMISSWAHNRVRSNILYAGYESVCNAEHRSVKLQVVVANLAARSTTSIHLSCRLATNYRVALSVPEGAKIRSKILSYLENYSAHVKRPLNGVVKNGGRVISKKRTKNSKAKLHGVDLAPLVGRAE